MVIGQPYFFRFAYIHGSISTTGVLSVTSQNTAETTAVYDVEAEDAAEGTVLLSGAEPAWCVLRWSEYENVDRTKKEKAMEIMNEPEEAEEAEICEGQDYKNTKPHSDKREAENFAVNMDNMMKQNKSFQLEGGSGKRRTGLVCPSQMRVTFHNGTSGPLGPILVQYTVTH